jgi:outer membrane biosynthesis protein TonB
MITGVELERGSGYPGLDLTAQRALLNTRQVPELPAAYPNSTLTVHLNFNYQR